MSSWNETNSQDFEQMILTKVDLTKKVHQNKNIQGKS